jgi:hypothetical protein
MSTGTDISALYHEFTDALTEVLAENAVGPARRGRLARARAAVKKHPEYTEHAVETAFKVKGLGRVRAPCSASCSSPHLQALDPRARPFACPLPGATRKRYAQVEILCRRGGRGDTCGGFTPTTSRIGETDDGPHSEQPGRRNA